MQQVISFQNNFSERKALKFLFAAAFLSEIFYSVLAFYSDGKESIPLYMFIYFEAFIVFFFGWFVIRKVILVNAQKNKAVTILARALSIEETEAFKLRLPLFVILTGLLFRLTLFPALPSTSNDVHRYIWEGKVVLNGFNTFTNPPNDKQLIPLRDNNYEKVTFKNIPAIYPPFSQLIFSAAYLISAENLLGLKLFYLICELFTLIFLLKLLYQKKINLNRIILYAWLPLPILEYFVNAHLDPIGIMFFTMSIYFIEKENYIPASVFLALTFLSKVIGIFLFPLILIKAGVKKGIIFIIVFFVVSLIFYLPFWEGNLSEFTALFGYISKWEFNGVIYNLLKALLDSGATARIICGIIFIILTMIISIRVKDFTRAGFYIFICWAILSTTLYPWYLGWLAVLNPFVNFFSAMSLFFTVNLTNFSPLGNEWREYLFVLVFEYVPFFLFLVYDFLFAARKIKD